MTTPNQPPKLAVIVDSSLSSSFAANTAAVLTLSLGDAHEGLIGRDLKDVSGSTHLGITTVPIPILSADQDTLRTTRMRARNEFADVCVVDFTDVAQRTGSYEEYARALEASSEEQLTYLGIALHGPKKPINKLTGNLSLLR